MKKKYSTPLTSIENAIPGSQLLRAGSIQNANGSVQHGIDENKEEDFEAGAKGGLWGDDSQTESPWDD